MPVERLRDFLRNGDHDYQYPTYEERLCARYGYEINSAFHGPNLDPDRDNPRRWGGLFRRAVERAARKVAEQDASIIDPHTEPDDSGFEPVGEQLTLPEEILRGFRRS